VVLKLGFVLISRHEINRTDRSILRSGIILIEWARRDGVELTPGESRVLAKGHFDLWRFGGFEIDKYHLDKALELYTSLIESPEVNDFSALWMEYCQVLQMSGDLEKAATVMQSVLAKFEEDSDYPSFLFFAGGLYKALKLHDKASNYFFEATQIGPPKLFSKLEMMCIISRNIEESSRGADDSNDPYKMVFNHPIVRFKI
jgi:tetratricopeptide (TPR) repeat protein